MKTTIIIHDDIRQIMFTPENDTEKQALKMISADDTIEIAVKQGSFHSDMAQRAGYNTGMCQGGYLKTWTDENSVMLILSKKKELK